MWDMGNHGLKRIDGGLMSEENPQHHIAVLERQLSAVRAIGELLASSVGLDSVFKKIIPLRLSGLNQPIPLLPMVTYSTPKMKLQVNLIHTI